MSPTEQAFTDGMKKLVDLHPTALLELDWSTAIALLAQVQLALRHPNNRGDSAATARSFCDGLIANIERVVPELGPLLRLGDDPQHDQPRSGT